MFGRAIQRRTAKSLTLPAPMGGLNTLSAGAAMTPDDCLVLWNLVAAEYGLRTRLGSKVWATLPSAEEVRTLIPFNGSAADGSKNRLFACTPSGVWDVTTGTPVAAKLSTGEDLTWSGALAGWGSFAGTVNAAGAHFLAYCDESNGYYLYRESTNDWLKMTATEVTGGVDPANFCFVTSWKHRLWFVERNTGRAWYLPIDSFQGAAAKFTFGSKFRAGGELRGLWSWTYDGGSGVDDALVAVSSAGDVLIYKGTDPASASTFAMSGTWHVGAVPAGRRLCTEVGGDLLVMSSLGLMPLTKLVAGAVNEQTATYPTARVSNLFNQLQQATTGVWGWGVRVHPADNTLIVTVPVGGGVAQQQLVMSLANKAWTRYRGLPMVSAEAFAGSFYFGTPDGKVCLNDGYLDGVEQDGTGGTPIDFSLVTAFQTLGSPTQKRVQLLRPNFMSVGSMPRYTIEARFRWDMREADTPNATLDVGGAARFDYATWASDSDTAPVFAGDYSAHQSIFGGKGMGTDVALAIRGVTQARMTLVSIDVAYDEGGFIL